jgi:hypothetical protein
MLAHVQQIVVVHARSKVGISGYRSRPGGAGGGRKDRSPAAARARCYRLPHSSSLTAPQGRRQHALQPGYRIRDLLSVTDGRNDSPNSRHSKTRQKGSSRLDKGSPISRGGSAPARPGGFLMAQIPPWYSIRQRDRNVFHDDDQCPVGKEIDIKYRKPGHRCRMRCPSCAKLGAMLRNPERLARLTTG